MWLLFESLKTIAALVNLPCEQPEPGPSPIFAILFIEIEQICSIPVAQIPYSAYKQATPVRVPILPLQNPHTFFFVFFLFYNSGCLRMFLRSFVANEMKYQLDLSVSVKDMSHKLILIRIILKPK